MNAPLLKECLGWTATVAFAASYLCHRQSALRAVQAVAAVLWIAYGVATGSLPVIASNTAVAFMAVIYPLIRQAAQRPPTSEPICVETDSRAPAFEELPHIV